MPYKSCTDYITNKKPDIRRYYSKDAAVRYAVSETDPEIFGTVVENLFNSFWYEDTDIIAIPLILFKMKKYEMLDIFIDKFKKIGSNILVSREKDLDPNDSSINLSDLKGLTDNIYCCLLGENMNKEEHHDLFFYSPLYFAMITGSIKSFKKILKEDYYNFSLSEFIESAINFRDTEFIEAIFKSGRKLHLGAILDNCENPDTVKYLCENFSEYIFTDDYEYTGEELSPSEFILHTTKPDEMLKIAGCYCVCHGAEHFDEIFKDLPKVSVIKESDMRWCQDLLTYELNGKINTKNIFADTVVCIVEYAAEIYHLPDNFVLDFSQLDHKSWLCEYSEASDMIKFLTTKNVRFNLSRLTEPVKNLLDYNNKTITKILISKEFINSINVDEVTAYLEENNLNKALEAVRDSEIPYMLLPF